MPSLLKKRLKLDKAQIATKPIYPACSLELLQRQRFGAILIEDLKSRLDVPDRPVQFIGNVLPLHKQGK